MLPAEGSVIGIDVGCSPSRRTGAVCRLEWNEEEIHCSLSRFRAAEPERSQTIQRIGGGGSVLAAAFDGPLRGDLEVVGRYRAAERMLTRRFQPYIGKPGQASAPVGRLLNEHTNHCARIVLETCVVAPASHAVRIHERAIAEAFPGAFMGVMIADPKALNANRANRSDVFFQHLAKQGAFAALARHHLPGRELSADPATLTNKDDRCAFICALTALGVAARDYQAVGDADGWIVLPPSRFVQTWASQFLEANAAEDPTGRLVIESPQDGAIAPLRVPNWPPLPGSKAE